MFQCVRNIMHSAGSWSVKRCVLNRHRGATGERLGPVRARTCSQGFATEAISLESQVTCGQFGCLIFAYQPVLLWSAILVVISTFGAATRVPYGRGFGN